MFVAILILCGIGLPLPEEVILIAAGYSIYNGNASAPVLVTACAGAILVGDALPFLLGRMFGPKLLRLRIIRGWINQRRLAQFDSWFRRHGRLTIFVARFLTGIRVPAFFAAGSMRMSVVRFLLMDLLGVLISVPLFMGIGNYSGPKIKEAVAWVQTLERGLLALLGIGAAVGVGIYFWYRRKHAKRLLGSEVKETFVGPPAPDGNAPDGNAPDGNAPDGNASDGNASDVAATGSEAPLSPPDRPRTDSPAEPPAAPHARPGDGDAS